MAKGSSVSHSEVRVQCCFTSTETVRTIRDVTSCRIRDQELCHTVELVGFERQGRYRLRSFTYSGYDLISASGGEVLSMHWTCALELPSSPCQSGVFTLFFQVKTENPSLLLCTLICRFTNPSPVMHVSVVCVCVCARARACVCVCVFV